MATNNAINQIGVLPAFSVYSNASQTSVTGDSTAVTVGYNTSVFDNTSSFNTGTNTFTAPLTGKYSFAGTVSLDGLTAAHFGYIYFITTALTYYPVELTWTSITNTAQLNFSLIIPLTAGDAVSVQAVINGGAKVVGILGLANYTFFGGYMIAGI